MHRNPRVRLVGIEGGLGKSCSREKRVHQRFPFAPTLTSAARWVGGPGGRPALALVDTGSPFLVMPAYLNAPKPKRSRCVPLVVRLDVFCKVSPVFEFKQLCFSVQSKLKNFWVYFTALANTHTNSFVRSVERLGVVTQNFGICTFLNLCKLAILEFFRAHSYTQCPHSR